jgi:hypothetical protein
VENKYIRVNSEKFFNLKIEIGEVLGWLKVIHNMTGVEDLSAALEICYSFVLDKEQSRAVVIVTELIYQEASGKIIPPINLYATYRDIASQIEGVL